MEHKRYDIIDCLSNGEAIPAHMAENCSGRWLDSKDPAIVQALAIASAAREAGMVDEHGRFRKVLGTLPITADGCVVGYDGFGEIHPVFCPRLDRLSTSAIGCRGQSGGVPELTAEFNLGRGCYEYVHFVDCYSTRSAAEAAAKGAGDAQG